jgi:hypothetical protein
VGSAYVEGEVSTGSVYVSDHLMKEGKRVLPDSAVKDKKRAVPPMFGHYLFMPLVKGKKGIDTIMNKQTSVVEAALRVK